MSTAIVVVWIVIAVGAAVIGTLAGSYDKSAPWPSLLAVAAVGAVAGGALGLALMRDNVSGTFIGTVIGAGGAVGIRSVLVRRREGSHV